ncbi:MAG: PTS sugar transporter subunit IIC [Treponema sp.]|nr:PTS sugar transporter subunit IIC [Treponema sp.]
MITGSTAMLAFILALFTGVLKVTAGLAMKMWVPLITGMVAGIITGDITLGLQIGAACSIMALGFYTYGGIVMPDYSIGAIFGVFIASQSSVLGIPKEEAIGQAGLVATAIALLMILFDILGRSCATFFLHGGENALTRRNLVSFQRWHLAGTIPWGLSRFIPVFIGMLFIGEYQEVAKTVQQLEWLQRGLSAVGAVLPAIGFAILLSRMDIKTYWPYMLTGFALYAYLGLPIAGLAVIGAAAAGLYMINRKSFSMKDLSREEI